MDGTIKLTAEESCEAVRAYLVLRGALPAHGKVIRVDGAEKQHYSGAIGVSATVEIGEPPAAPLAESDKEPPVKPGLQL